MAKAYVQLKVYHVLITGDRPEKKIKREKTLNGFEVVVANR